MVTEKNHPLNVTEAAHFLLEMWLLMIYFQLLGFKADDEAFCDLTHKNKFMLKFFNT